MSLRHRARAGLTPHILYIGPECTCAVNLMPCPLYFRYPLNGAMGGPPLVWAMQRGEKPLAPAGNRTVLPWMYSIQWLSYTGLPVISSKTAMQSTGVQMQVLYTSECTSECPDDLQWIGGTKSVFSWHITHASWNQRSVTTLRSDGRQATQLRPTQPSTPDSEFTVRYALLV